MAAVPTGDVSDYEDPEYLRDDLIFKVTLLSGDLKLLGYEQFQIPDFMRAASNGCLDSKTTEADRAHAEIEGRCEINECSRFAIGSFGGCPFEISKCSRFAICFFDRCQLWRTNQVETSPSPSS